MSHTLYEILSESNGSGEFISDVFGEDVGEHKLVYLDADARWYLADADDANKQPIIGLTLGATSAGNVGRILLRGYVADNSWSWAIGGVAGIVYASTTPGELTQVAPVGTLIIAAIARTPTSILFCFPAMSGSGGWIFDPEHTASFIIWTDGVGNYYRKDGHTGIITSGADAKALITSSMAVGKKTLLKDGTYNILTNIQIPVDATLEGSGRGTILNLAVDAYVYLNGSGGTLKNLKITGSAPVLIAASNCTVDNVVSYSDELNAYNGAFFVAAVNATIENTQILNCQAIDCGVCGFMLSGGGAPKLIRNTRIINCQAINCGRYTQITPWVVGFDLAETADIDGLFVSDCYAYRNFEDGFHMESARDKNNIVITNCVSEYNGLDKVAPPFGCGFIVNNSVSISNCVSRGNAVYGYMVANYKPDSINISDCVSYADKIGIVILGAISEVLVDNFTSHDSTEYGLEVYLAANIKGNFKIYNPTGLGGVCNNIRNSYDCDFTIIGEGGGSDFFLWNFHNEDIVWRGKLNTTVNQPIGLDQCTDIIIQDMEIITTGNHGVYCDTTTAGTVIKNSRIEGAIIVGVMDTTTFDTIVEDSVDFDNCLARTSGCIAKRVYTVSRNNGDYPTLTTALAAIVDASASKRYAIIVRGDIDETALITAKSYVDVSGDGGELIITTNTNGAGVTFNSLVYTEWSHLIIRRGGAVPVWGTVATYLGTTDSTVKMTDVSFLNDIVNGALYSLNGVSIAASPTFTNCMIVGGGGLLSYGVYSESGSAEFNGCIITGGSNTSGAGVYTTSISQIKLISSTLTGGSGASSEGLLTYGASSPELVNCIIQGGSNPTAGYGLNTYWASSPKLTGCTIRGNGEASTIYNVGIHDNSAPQFKSCKIAPTVIPVTFSYDDANNGRFIPFAGDPYMIDSISVYVGSATGGATLSIGTTVGGNEVAAGIDLTATGGKSFTFTRSQLAANTYLYATPSAAAADGSFTIYYSVVKNYDNNWGIYMNTYGLARVEDCEIIGNGASWGMFISNIAESGNNWKVSNSHLERMDPTATVIYCESAYVGVPIYESTIIGSLTNVSGLAHMNSGTATLLNGQNHVHVTHGLGYTPTAAHISIVFTEAPTNATTYWYLSTPDATEFILYANDPGASNLDFSWAARKTP